MNLEQVNKDLYDLANLIAAYTNPHMFHDLRELTEEERLQDLYGLEELFAHLLSLRNSLQN